MAILVSMKRTRPIDENLMALRVVNVEGKKESISIAQVKEVQKIVLDMLAVAWQTNPRGVVALLRKHAK